MATASCLPTVDDPKAVGLSSPRLRQVMDVLHAEVDANRIPGAVLGIARRGTLAFLEAVGYRDKQAGEPMGTDAIFRLASMTKPIVSVAAMTLVERGKLFLGDPVSEYLPQFADMKVAVDTRDSRTGAATLVLEPASTPMTVHDVLRHTAGMVNPATQPVTPVRQRYIDAGINDEDQTLAERVDKLARMPLAHHPGTAWDYSHGVDVMGRTIWKGAIRDRRAARRARQGAPLARRRQISEANGTGAGEPDPGRSVHASPTPFRMSPTLRTPDATAFSAHRRAADQNAILCAAQQKRFGEPPRRGRNGRLHHRHSGKVIMRNSSAAIEGCEAPRALLTSAGALRIPI